MGLARFGKLSVDGTKVRANASKRKATGYGRMLRRERELEAGIGALPDRARDTDAREDERFGEAFRGDELPEELRRRGDRLAAIRAAKEDLEAEQRGADDARGREPGRERNPKGGRPCKRAYGEPDGKARSNLTDPDSAIMRTSSEGFQQCYKRYAQHKWLSEAPNGRIKEILGFRRFSVRGLAKARGEWTGMSGAGHQAAAGAPGSVRVPAHGISS